MQTGKAVRGKRKPDEFRLNRFRFLPYKTKEAIYYGAGRKVEALDIRSLKKLDMFVINDEASPFIFFFEMTDPKRLKALVLGIGYKTKRWEPRVFYGECTLGSSFPQEGEDLWIEDKAGEKFRLYRIRTIGILEERSRRCPNY